MLINHISANFDQLEISQKQLRGLLNSFQTVNDRLQATGKLDLDQIQTTSNSKASLRKKDSRKEFFLYFISLCSFGMSNLCFFFSFLFDQKFYQSNVSVCTILNLFSSRAQTQSCLKCACTDHWRARRFSLSLCFLLWDRFFEIRLSICHAAFVSSHTNSLLFSASLPFSSPSSCQRWFVS